MSKEFHEISGLLINPSKNEVFFARMSQETKHLDPLYLAFQGGQVVSKVSLINFVTKNYRMIQCYSNTYHDLDNLVFTTIHFLLNILLLIFFYIILLFVSHSLPKKCDYFLSLSLSLQKNVIILSLSLSLINSFLQLYFRLIFFFNCVSTFGSIHFGGVFFEVFRSESLSLYQNTIYTIMYSNVSINYLNNINCKFVMRFGYHDNLLKKMRYSNN